MTANVLIVFCLPLLQSVTSYAQPVTLHLSEDGTLIVSDHAVPSHSSVQFTVVQGPPKQPEDVWIGLFVRFWSSAGQSDNLSLTHSVEICNESLQPGVRVPAFSENTEFVTFEVKRYSHRIRTSENFQVVNFNEEGDSYLISWQGKKTGEPVTIRVKKALLSSPPRS